MGYCCEELKREMTQRKHEGIELIDGRLCVNGCCGGGCFVLTDLRFCPFCGYDLDTKQHRLTA